MSSSNSPHRRTWVRGMLVCVLAATLLAAGCSGKAEPTGGGAALSAGQGVTDKVIRLGVLSDRTGAFAGAGKGIEQGRELYWAQRNAQGGVCGRQVEFVVK